MSDFYEVKVLARRGRSVTLDVQVVHRDAMTIPGDPGFALILLHEATGKTSALAREMSIEDLVDEPWVERWANGFVESVRVTDRANEPTAAALADRKHPYWKSLDGWLRAKVDITATDEAWVEHLAPGQSYDSRAYAPAKTYAACAPIHRGDPAPDAPLDDGFIWVPKEVFLDSKKTFQYADVPSLLELPAYARSAYELASKMTKKTLDLAKVREWAGHAAWIEGKYHDEHGAIGYVLPNGKALHLCFDRSSTQVGHPEIERAGRLVLKPGRRGSRLSYRDVLAKTPVVASTLTRAGRTLEITLRVPPGHTVPIASATDVLPLLVQPLEVRKGLSDELRDSHFKREYEKELISRSIDPSYSRIEDFYPVFASRVIASYALEALPRNEAPDLDAMTHAQAREALSKPWLEVTLRVEVTDERWVEHFDARQKIELPLKSTPRSAPSA